MKRLLSLCLVAAGCAILPGCGQKGALYLPDEQRNQQVAPAAAAPEAAPAPADDSAPAAAAPDPADPESRRRSNNAPPTN